MAIIAKEESGGRTFVPAPEGQFVAVCCDVVDLGIEHGEWKGQPRSVHKIRIVFQINEYMDDGRPFTVGQKFTLSLGEKANLRKFLEQWIGRPFKPEELRDGFDVERLIGAGALLQLVQVERAGNVYTNIQTVMKAPKGMPTPTVRDYTRVQDRDGTMPQAQPARTPAPQQQTAPQRQHVTSATYTAPDEDVKAMVAAVLEADDLPF